MSLTPEMQAQIDMQSAIENNRAASAAAAESKRAKMELTRMAKDILVENRRTKTAAESSDITASEVTALAADLVAFVNS